MPDNSLAAGARRERTEQEIRIVSLDRPRSAATAVVKVRTAARRLAPLVAAGALAAAAPAAAQERALEAVSPIESEGQSLDEVNGFTWGSLDGNRAFYSSSVTPIDYPIATRTAAGWVTSLYRSPIPGWSTAFVDATDDMSTLIVAHNPAASAPGRQHALYHVKDGQATPVWAPDDPTAVDGTSANHPEYLGASKDREVLVVRESDPAFLPGPDSNTGLYRWTRAGGLEPINVDLSRYEGICTPAAAEVSNTNMPSWHSAISADGRTIAVRVPGCGGVQPHIYLWRDGTSIDITQPLTGEPDAAADLRGMSDDGSRVYFSTTGKLVPEDTGGADLYVWDDGTLERLTEGNFPTVNGPQGASQPTEDGSAIWFRTTGPIGSEGEAGKANYWVWDGELRFARAFGTAQPPYLFWRIENTGEASADGSTFVFATNYDFDTGAGLGQRRIFRLDRSGDVQCVSCPSGGSPSSSAALGLSLRGFDHAWKPRVSADGRIVVFETQDALVPEDTNGRIDVYAWEDGRHTLISSGTEPTDALFKGMTPDASTIFFSSHGALLPGTTDTYRKLYASRVGGGFPVARAPEGCGAGCQGPLSPPPALPVAASVTFSGPGNLVPPPARSEGSRDRRQDPEVRRPGTVRGSTTLVRVKVPSAGTIRVTGSRIKNVSRTVRKAGTYRIRVRLSKRYQRSLARRGRLAAALRVRFAPDDGPAKAMTVRLQFRRASGKAAR
jgi:hypothetical protein